MSGGARRLQWPGGMGRCPAASCCRRARSAPGRAELSCCRAACCMYTYPPSLLSSPRPVSTSSILVLPVHASSLPTIVPVCTVWASVRVRPCDPQRKSFQRLPVTQTVFFKVNRRRSTSRRRERKGLDLV